MRSVRKWAAGCCVVAAAATPLVAADAPDYAGPWDAAAEAAAEAAVARLGVRALAVSGRVVTVRGLDLAAGGGGVGIVASVQQVRQAMQDLGARETELEVTVDLPADVLFDFDKADIRPDAAAALAKLATVIRAYPSGAVLLEGHTDAVGDDAYNDRLSLRRAESVKAWLVDREGITAAMTTAGKGEREPVASNDDDAGRQKNRRVRAVIRKGQ